ncbi:MAG: succinate dehydrogenase cytochrome b558 subunit [Lacipirellulaceae bacterium]
MAAKQSFLVRNEFLVRRLHSLSGLIPVGAFMCVHLGVNASILNGPETFQNNVYAIHALDKLLPLVEWTFIFLPLLFHALVGVWIIQSGLPNTNLYGYGANIRYTLQRASGMLAMVFIFYHVFHMHGWFHFDWWLAIAEPLGGAEFRPFNAPTTAGAALQNPVIVAFYALGVLASVFHLANGLWTMGITWGVWTSPAAQKKALAVCAAFGVVLGAVGFSGLGGMMAVGSGEAFDAARMAEDRMYEARVAAGSVTPNEHKRVGEHSTEGDAEGAEAQPKPVEAESVSVSQ